MSKCVIGIHHGNLHQLIPISRNGFNDCAKHSLQKSSLLRANQTAGQLNRIEIPAARKLKAQPKHRKQQSKS
jgi:hypothetical protein